MRKQKRRAKIDLWVLIFLAVFGIAGTTVGIMINSQYYIIERNSVAAP